MICPDANLLLYAEVSLSRHHQAACQWWDAVLSGSEPVYLCWPVLNAFIRIATNPRLHDRPLALDEAIARVDSWLAQPCVHVVSPRKQLEAVPQATQRFWSHWKPSFWRPSGCACNRAWEHFVFLRSRLRPFLLTSLG